MLLEDMHFEWLWQNADTGLHLAVHKDKGKYGNMINPVQALFGC